MNKGMRIGLSAGIPALILFVVVSVFLWQQRGMGQITSGNGAQQLTPVTIAMDWTPNTNHTGLHVANAKGWYREQGVELKILPYSASVTADALVYSGKADVGVGYAEGVVADAAVGQPVVSIGAIMQRNTSALVALADSGIKSPKDLDGKTYGGFGAPSEEAVVSQVIKNAGGQGKFKNVTLNTGAMEALKAKRIDFVWIYMGVDGVQAELEGLKLISFPIVENGIPDYYTPTFITGQQQIKQKPDVLRKFMAATAKGYEFARSNPREAADLLIQANVRDLPDKEFVYASQEYNSKAYTKEGQTWGIQEKRMWTEYSGFMLRKGVVTDASGQVVEELNLDSLYTNEFLPK